MERRTGCLQSNVNFLKASLTKASLESQQKIDAARATLEAERSEQIGAANARISEQRAAATAEVEAARQAARRCHRRLVLARGQCSPRPPRACSLAARPPIPAAAR